MFQSTLAFHACARVGTVGSERLMSCGKEAPGAPFPVKRGGSPTRFLTWRNTAGFRYSISRPGHRFTLQQCTCGGETKGATLAICSGVRLSTIADKQESLYS